MSLKGVTIVKGGLGANRLGSEDSISALIVSYLGTGVLTGFEESAIVQVFNMNDVKALGITEESDETNAIVLYRHLSEFYRNAGEGKKLYLAHSPNGFENGVFEFAKQVLNEAGGEIKQIGFVNAMKAQPVTIQVDGLPDVVGNAIPLAQAFYNWSYDNFMPVQILLEGFNVQLPASSMLDLRDITDLEADKVSLVIGQDYTYAKELPESLRNYADVGTALGIMARAKVHENIGDNEQYNLTDSTRGAWLEVGISSHQKNSDIADQLQTLDTKGYIFGVNYTGLAGVRFNNDHVCAPVVIDAENNMNEHSIAYGRVANKAVRELRSAYLPKVKTTWNVDSTTGKLSSGTIVALEDIGDQVFADMLERGEISYGKAIVDPESDLLVEKILRISYVIVPKGTINKIEGSINLKTRE